MKGMCTGSGKPSPTGNCELIWINATVPNILMGIAEFTGGHWVLNEGSAPPDEVFEQIMAFIERGLTARGEQ